MHIFFSCKTLFLISIFHISLLTADIYLESWYSEYRSIQKLHVKNNIFGRLLCHCCWCCGQSVVFTQWLLWRRGIISTTMQDNDSTSSSSPTSASCSVIRQKAVAAFTNHCIEHKKTLCSHELLAHENNMRIQTNFFFSSIYLRLYAYALH